ncbi:MAG: PQQ-binding-like beta-propeller repeat protein [Planctomycetaceae bacterium]|nr:PQQ-binding-like beta-propeller repeat protein [Planctomycetaceae bacterium]
MRHFFCTLVAVLFLTSQLFAADWPVFHGPNGDNKSPDTGMLKKWSPDGPKLLWTIDYIGHGFSSVSISEGKLYITGNVQRDGKELSMIFCINKDGKKIWENDNGPGQPDKQRYAATRGTPHIDGEFLYDISAVGEVGCFNKKTGEKIWNRNVMTDYNGPIPWWFLGHMPVVDGDNVICMVGGPKTLAVALDKRTGKTVWESPVADSPKPATGYTTPYLFDFEGIRVVVVMSQGSAEGLDAKTGKRLFAVPWSNKQNCHCAKPIYRNGNLLMTTAYEGGGSKLFKLTKNADGTITPTEMWYEPRFNHHHGGVILVDDYVYGTVFDGSWCSINFLTGEMGYKARSIGSGSVHYADGLIYGLSESDQTVILLKPEPKEYVEISRFELPNEAEGKSWAHPVVLNGKLYLRHAQYLYCYDVKAP